MPIHTMPQSFVMQPLAPGRYSDGGGLYLHVRPGKARSWIVILHDKGKRRELTIGPAAGPDKPGLSLDDARTAAEDKRRARKQGVLIPAPVAFAETASETKVYTFEHVAADWLETIHKPAVSKKTFADTESLINRHAAKLLNMDITAIKPSNVEAVLAPIWSRINRSANDLQAKLEIIFDFAIAYGAKNDVKNPKEERSPKTHYLPSDAINPAERRRLPLADLKIATTHHRAVPWERLPAMMTKIRSRNEMAARALEFAILCAARPSEARGARVSEIDFKQKLWVIPVARMKVKKIKGKNGKWVTLPDHVVPLSLQAIELLRRLIPHDAAPDSDDLIFEGEKAGQMLGHNALTHTLVRVAPNTTAHGTARASFSSWNAKKGKFYWRYVEAALAHTFKAETEEAYNRTLESPYVEERGPLMQAWADYLDSAKEG
ncbi:tyrosine-type recombinase/integrase [Bradyrhizobium daqingense]|uniref:Integrase-like protein n=1 Tax=Bradyrhizobium daqingense TaxID=993502 RepID=A0A562L498_9BRAD|nr:tyrosine-type recombinase/integrase [Bradyrhizobium daqingense]TWI02480.1 integrase-like protein [Bradyrhizobium daqingense]UFS90949.1 tyrosine-type recombinase/integrase [Bradyrhizobium daqingense]